MQGDILILGGGFIGQNLARRLIKHADAQISVFDRSLPMDPYPGIEYIMGDFFNINDLTHAVEGKSYVVHAISTINPGNSNAAYAQAYEKDVLQTIALCDILKEQGSKLVFLSSGGTIYGEQKLFPIPEDAITSPINHYGGVKLCLENFMRIYNRQFGTDFKIVRIANPYGPGQDYRSGVGFIDAALRCALDGNPLTIWGDGMTVRDYIHIDDACCMIASIMCDEGPFDTFNIGSGIGASQNDIVDIVKGLYPSLVVRYKERRSVDVAKIILDTTRVQSIYPYKLVSLEDGIESYYRYLKEGLCPSHTSCR